MRIDTRAGCPVPLTVTVACGHYPANWAASLEMMDVVPGEWGNIAGIASQQVRHTALTGQCEERKNAQS